MASVAESYFPIAIFSIIAVLFVIFSLLGSRFFSPFRPNPKKLTTYECGELPEGQAAIQFNFQYYMFALIFVVFDVISIFLLLWGLSFAGLASTAKLQMAVFIGLLLVALAYALKKESFIKI